MGREREYWVYIMSSRTRVLYVGMTNDLLRRISEHQEKKTPGFTQRYNVTRLVHAESFRDVYEAIERENEIKGWLRSRKVALVEEENPLWKDLSEELQG